MMPTPILVSKQLTVAGDNTAYSVITGRTERVDQIATFSLCNTIGSSVIVSVSVLPTGGTLDGTHRVVNSYSLAANDTITQEDILSGLKGMMLGVGSSISVNVDTANAVDAVITGLVVN